MKELEANLLRFGAFPLVVASNEVDQHLNLQQEQEDDDEKEEKEKQHECSLLLDQQKDRLQQVHSPTYFPPPFPPLFPFPFPPPQHVVLLRPLPSFVVL